MKKSRYTEEQIAFALKQAELGTPVNEVCRKLGVSEPTFYRWKSKFGGMLPSDMKRLKQLEEENATETTNEKSSGEKRVIREKMSLASFPWKGNSNKPRSSKEIAGVRTRGKESRSVAA